MRLHLICTLHGLPIGFALTGAKADEREVLQQLLADPAIATLVAGQVVIGDKYYFGRDFQAHLAQEGIHLLRPARRGEPARAGSQFLKPLRQVIESIFDTFKGQLDLEQHGGAHHRRRGRACLATPARADRNDLAQRPHRQHPTALTDRLRPLTTTGNYSD